MKLAFAGRLDRLFSKAFAEADDSKALVVVDRMDRQTDGRTDRRTEARRCRSRGLCARPRQLQLQAVSCRRGLATSQAMRRSDGRTRRPPATCFKSNYDV